MVRLILTSDDFGISNIWNIMMIDMLKANLLSSVSIMADRITSDQENQIIELRRLYTRNDFSIGLHLEISDENYEEEIQNQWSNFQRLLDRQPDYVDVHKGHLHTDKFDTIAKICSEKNVSFRKYNETTVVVSSPYETLIATFLKREEITKWIDQLQDGHIYELVFHIGVFDPESTSSLNEERVLDTQMLMFVNRYLMEKNISIINYRHLLC